MANISAERVYTLSLSESELDCLAYVMNLLFGHGQASDDSLFYVVQELLDMSESDWGEMRNIATQAANPPR